VAFLIADLQPPDFYLRRFLKENLYKSNPYSLEELKQSTQLRISTVTVETLERFASNMRKGMNARVAESSGHF
jgi:hypothetical protein